MFALKPVSPDIGTPLTNFQDHVVPVNNLWFKQTLVALEDQFVTLLCSTMIAMHGDYHIGIIAD